jgi:hypothetical protein
MNGPRPRRPAVIAIPLLLGLLGAQRAAAHVRTVDFLQLLASGALIAVGVMELVRAFRARSA